MYHPYHQDVIAINRIRNVLQVHPTAEQEGQQLIDRLEVASATCMAYNAFDDMFRTPGTTTVISAGKSLVHKTVLEARSAAERFLAEYALDQFRVVISYQGKPMFDEKLRAPDRMAAIEKAFRQYKGDYSMFTVEKA
jgi:hypothetical protein